ncbi:hypothetical protein Omtje3_8 [Cellulophaga phage Omtje_3]|nr:hypothetical protein Omtje2_8 [Cellulophaga phage Omtje_2]QQV90381.1 hypothetical protein Omtje3_8 [Cellulophaga phage Omtje_3]QQV90394.1 hypothetical protein Omtje4_8 [Cellulophaga phage Omtje_4]
MKVSRQMLADFLGCSISTSNKKYKELLLLIDVNRTYLTIYDVASLHGMECNVVASLMGVIDKKVLSSLISCKTF